MINITFLLRFKIVLLCCMSILYGCQNKNMENEIKKMNQLYPILKRDDAIIGKITDKYQPTNFRYDGKTLCFTINSTRNIQLFAKLDLQNTFDLILDVCINDSVIKGADSDTVWVFKYNSGERLYWVIDSK